MHTQIIRMQGTRASSPVEPRPDISVYWKPGCSMCLKVKEFLTDLGVTFESLNVAANPDALDELMASGVRGLPVVRRGEEMIIAQSLDDLAEFVGAAHDVAAREKLTQEQLLDRWGEVLDRARVIIVDFTEEQLERQAILGRDRTIKELSSHVFQIPEAFLTMVEEGRTNIREMMGRPRSDIVTRNDLHAYVQKIDARYRDWRRRGGESAIGDHITTFWGTQPSHPVLERFVWHSTQHSRQLDVIAAGMGAEFRIPPELYAGLPLPNRLWA
ncbi:glutaredoxin family protein [Pseudochelatococcus sp. B33]